MKQQIKFAFALFLVAILISPSNAQLRSVPEKIRVVYSAIGASQSTLWIPYEAGIFRKNGADVELLYVGEAPGHHKCLCRATLLWVYLVARL